MQLSTALTPWWSTLPDTNIAPENRLEDDISFWDGLFLEAMLGHFARMTDKFRHSEACHF